MPRGARLDAPGTLHHVILRGIEKRRIVKNDHDRSDFIDRLGELSIDQKAPVYAWALMDNHAHILLRSGPQGLSALMRKLLTGYAIRYNLRHKRHGYLFQNRYKSIVVEEDAYFKELVRYIHLNPLRAGMVGSLISLERHPWCGHSVIMGRIENDWQDSSFVLKWFGNGIRQARSAYRQYVDQGIEMGRQPLLIGGGLVRSLGGWAEVKALKRIGAFEKGDERILGRGRFVEQMLKEADLTRKCRLSNTNRYKAASEMINAYCEKMGISLQALREGGRQRSVAKARSELATRLVEELGFSYAEIARMMGVSSSAISKAMMRKISKKSV